MHTTRLVEVTQAMCVFRILFCSGITDELGNPQGLLLRCYCLHLIHLSFGILHLQGTARRIYFRYQL